MTDEDDEPLGEMHFTRRTVPPELRLWQAVILQAVQDAQRSGLKAGADRDSARRWLTGNGWQFRMVCDLAGMSPERVAGGARKTALTTKAYDRKARRFMRAKK